MYLPRNYPTTTSNHNLVPPEMVPSSTLDQDEIWASSTFTSTKDRMNHRRVNRQNHHESDSYSDEKRRVQHDYHDHARDGNNNLVDTMIQTNNIETSSSSSSSGGLEVPQVVSSSSASQQSQDVVTSDDEQSKKARRGPRGGVAVPFPEKLHYMLTKVHDDELTHIVSWQPHGRCFVVHKAKEFVADVMPVYFRQTKLTSFQRQLNLYGFCRLTSGRDRGGYYHELFLQGRPLLSKRMMRTRIKGTGIKAASSPQTEPDFYSMPPVHGTTWNVNDRASDDMIDSHSGSMFVTPCETRKMTLQPPRGLDFPPPLDDDDDIEPMSTLMQVVRNTIVTPPSTPRQGPTALLPHHPSEMSLCHDIQPDELISFEGQHFHYLDPTMFDHKMHESSNTNQVMVVVDYAAIEQSQD